MIKVLCGCGEVYHAEDSHRGRALRCRKCGTVLNIGNTKERLAQREDEIVPPTASPLAKSDTAWRFLQEVNLGRPARVVVACTVLILLILAVAFWPSQRKESEASENLHESVEPITPVQPIPVQQPVESVQSVRPEIPPCALGKTPAP
jgi:hypothetical protein